MKISIALGWNFNWHVFTAGQMFMKLTYSQHHCPAGRNFSGAGVFLQYGQLKLCRPSRNRIGIIRELRR